MTEPSPETTTPSSAIPPARPRSRVKELLLLVVSTALSLLAGLVLFESYLRLETTSTPNLGCYEIDFEIGKVLRPGFKGDHYGAPVSINAFGMRDRDTTLERPKGAKRILALGDSWTFGVSVKVEDSWPKQLETLLGGPDQVEVLNSGVSGYETYNEAVHYRRDLAKLDHDVALIGYYPVNDVHDKTGKYDRHKWLYDTHPLLYDLWVFPKQHLLIHHFYNNWRKQRKSAAREKHFSAPAEQRDALRGHGFVDEDWTELYDDRYSGWPLVKKSLLEIGDTARRHGARPVLVLFPDVQDLTRYEGYVHPKIAPLLAEACKAAGIDFIDVKDDFHPWVGREPEIASVAGSTHVNEKGYAVIAKALEREIRARGLLDKKPAH